MVKLKFDFRKTPPQIDVNNEKISKDDITLLRTTFYQMSLGKKFLEQFILQISGKTIDIVPVDAEKKLVKNIAKVQDVFKNLSKDAVLAYRDFVRVKA